MPQEARAAQDARVGVLHEILGVLRASRTARTRPGRAGSTCAPSVSGSRRRPAPVSGGSGSALAALMGQPAAWQRTAPTLRRADTRATGHRIRPLTRSDMSPPSVRRRPPRTHPRARAASFSRARPRVIPRPARRSSRGPRRDFGDQPQLLLLSTLADRVARSGPTRSRTASRAQAPRAGGGNLAGLVDPRQQPVRATRPRRTSTHTSPSTTTLSSGTSAKSGSNDPSARSRTRAAAGSSS